jgi:cytochrome c oxidase subunit 2
MSENLHLDNYEKNWLKISIVILVIFAAAVFIAGFGLGYQLPGAAGRVDPQTVTKAGPFAEPGIREVSPGHYEVYMIARAWSFVPREISGPVGSTVTFYVTSPDVQHGFKLQNTNLNMMVVPGQVSTLTATFDKPGTYDFVCTEYCGSGHAAMFGTLTVES